MLTNTPLKQAIAAVSVGMVHGAPLLDLSYPEDSRASADLNVVMTGDGEFVEVQGTAEGAPFSPQALDRMLDLAHQGIKSLLAAQEQSHPRRFGQHRGQRVLPQVGAPVGRRHAATRLYVSACTSSRNRSPRSNSLANMPNEAQPGESSTTLPGSAACRAVASAAARFPG